MHSFTFLFDIPQYQLDRNRQKVAGGFWKQGIVNIISSGDLVMMIKKAAIALIKNGVGQGDRVMLYADRYSIEWLATDMAIMSIGAISVPLHFPAKDEDIVGILKKIEPKLIIYTTHPKDSSASTESILLSIEDLIYNDHGLNEMDVEELHLLRDKINGDDIATIVHTSGSSGKPRAVALSHLNLVSNVMSVLSLAPYTPGTRVLSFLPLSHIFERIVTYVYMASGANIYFLESYRNAVFALKDVRPQYFTSVPMILERFAAVMEERVEETSWLTRWAYNSWEKTNRGIFAHLGSIIAHQWIIKRWKRKMGGQLKGIVSGAAYLDPKVERLYERSGIKIRQGYGLSEASPIVTLNRFEPGGHRRGTVGQPIPGVEVRIDENGEVLVKGPNVMIGYYKDENGTREVIRDGWLHTGDIGHWEHEHFLVITDRKSNIYKHASGKFISPAQIELKLVRHELIYQAIVIGFHKPFNMALIVPDFKALEKYCIQKNIHWTAPEYMVFNTLVIALYRDILDHLGLQSHERIEKFTLLSEVWSPENGLLTSTYKPRRKEIEDRYEKEVEEIYSETR